MSSITSLSGCKQITTSLNSLHKFPISRAVSIKSGWDDKGEDEEEIEQEPGEHDDDDDDDDDDDRPIAHSRSKPLPLAPKRSIDESSASTTLTTTSDDAIQHRKPLQPQNAISLPRFKKKPSSRPDPIPSDDDDQPLVSRPSHPSESKPTPRLKPGNYSSNPGPPSRSIQNRTSINKSGSDSEDSDAKPLIQATSSNPSQPKAKKPRLSNKAANNNSTRKKPVAPRDSPDDKDSEESDEEPTATRRKNDKKSKSTAKGGAGQTKKEIEAAKEAEMYKWWEENKDDDSKKWTTLEHNGVLFPPDYEPLPSHVKMKYNGRPVDLPPESEEVAFFFGSMLNTDHVQKPTFCQNFFEDFCDVLKAHPPRDGTKITEFSRCDFTPIFEWADSEREKRKNLPKDDKKRLAAEKLELESQYRTCLLDGRKEKVGNFRVEPPGLFRGRGEHPKTGRLKRRVTAEDITINCSADSKFPEPPPGHQWAEVVHVETASWLAFWKENINGHTKYVFLAAGSSLKGQSDMKKFEKARELKKHIGRIRADYQAELSDKVMATRQRATAMYLIDRFALRAGNEKGDDEADTVGCCSLRYEHVTLEPPNTVTFDFLGKDSIRFFNTFQVDEAVFKNLRIFKKPPKDVGDPLFDRLSPNILNKHLSDYMPGLTAKVFRTYNASVTFEAELEKNMKELPDDATSAQKLYQYNKANRQVAVLCNHQKSVSKNHSATMMKAADKVKSHKYERLKMRRLLLAHYSKFLDKATRRKLEVEESDLDDDWIEKYEESLELKRKDAVVKRYSRMEEAELEIKRKNELGIPIDDADSSNGDKKKPLLKKKEREAKQTQELEELEGYAERLKTERLCPQTVIPSDISAGAADRLLKKFDAINERIHASRLALKDRDEGKETSLGTSKTNYIDPRISFAWLTKHEVEPKRIFPKTLQEKFTWAAATKKDWKF